MSIGWPDIGGALLWIAGTLLVLAAVIGLLVWDARRRRSPAIMVDVAGAAARMWLALVLVGLILLVLKWTTAGFTEVSALPISMQWPTPLPCAGDAPPTTEPTLACAGISNVDATLTGLSLATRATLAAGDLLTLVLVALPAVVVAVICRATLRRKPFSRVTSRWLVIAAIVLLVAGMGGQVLTDIGSSMAAAEVLPPPGVAGVTTTGIYRLTLPLWPIGASLALAALAAVFRFGARLQHETDLLV